MTVVFDAARVPFSGNWTMLIPVAALVITLVMALRRKRKRRVLLIGGGLTLFLTLLLVVLPIADYRHVRAALTNGSARTVEGIISQHSRETTRRRRSSGGMGVGSYNSYTSSTSEQFYVGRQWFWLRVGGFPSGASFTNAVDPPFPLRDGMHVRVTWFPDSWNGDETRILKLEVSKDRVKRPAAAAALPMQAAPPAGTAQALPADFAAFWARFSKAAAQGDKEGIKAMTRFPFRFAGTPLDPTRFDSIWMGIFPEPLRACFASAAPVRDGESWSASCGPYVYLFGKGTTGWQFTDFAADPEAAQ